MPYKRRARVLFISQKPSWVTIACLYAKTIGADWIDPRPGKLPLQEDMLSWPDLVVTLDKTTQATLPILPPLVRNVHWAVEGENDIQYHICGMIGGMQLLSRIDNSETTR